MNNAALLQAVFTRLGNVPAVAGNVAGIYSDHPQGADAEAISAFPYITLGPIIPAPFNTKTNDGASALFQIHTWDRRTSKLARLGLQDAIYDALQNFDLVISGSNTVLVQCQSTNEMDDPDGITKHGILIFRILHNF